MVGLYNHRLVLVEASLVMLEHVALPIFTAIHLAMLKLLLVAQKVR